MFCSEEIPVSNRPKFGAIAPKKWNGSKLVLVQWLNSCRTTSNRVECFAVAWKRDRRFPREFQIHEQSFPNLNASLGIARCWVSLKICHLFEFIWCNSLACPCTNELLWANIEIEYCCAQTWHNYFATVALAVYEVFRYGNNRNVIVT